MADNPSLSDLLFAEDADAQDADENEFKHLRNNPNITERKDSGHPRPQQRGSTSGGRDGPCGTTAKTGHGNPTSTINPLTGNRSPMPAKHTGPTTTIATPAAAAAISSTPSTAGAASTSTPTAAGAGAGAGAAKWAGRPVTGTAYMRACGGNGSVSFKFASANQRGQAGAIDVAKVSVSNRPSHMSTAAGSGMNAVSHRARGGSAGGGGSRGGGSRGGRGGGSRGAGGARGARGGGARGGGAGGGGAGGGGAGGALEAGEAGGGGDVLGRQSGGFPSPMSIQSFGSGSRPGPGSGSRSGSGSGSRSGSGSGSRRSSGSGPGSGSRRSSGSGSGSGSGPGSAFNTSDGPFSDDKTEYDERSSVGTLTSIIGSNDGEGSPGNTDSDFIPLSNVTSARSSSNMSRSSSAFGRDNDTIVSFDRGDDKPDFNNPIEFSRVDGTADHSPEGSPFALVAGSTPESDQHSVEGLRWAEGP